MPKWRKDATEFTVGVNFHKVRGYQSSIPRPVMEALKEPKAIKFVLNEGRVELQGTEPPQPRPRRIITTKMSYTEFRSRVKAILQYSDKGMTWTGIRATLKLDQVVPNNKWVREMEKDIGLVRLRNSDGTVVWRLTHVR